MIPRSLPALALLAAVPSTAAHSQDTTAAERAFVLEGRLGIHGSLGGRSRSLVGPEAAAGVTLAFQLSRRWWGWTAVDYRPDEAIVFHEREVPAVELYTLTAGVSRTFGLPFVPSRWRPVEIGVGVGATQSEIQANATTFGNRIHLMSDGSPFPPDAEFESPLDKGLLSWSRWRPTTTARLRMAIPVGPLRMSATVAVLATYIGDVPLWDGEWEPTGEGTRYRPVPKRWRFGTIFTAPLTFGMGFRF